MAIVVHCQCGRVLTALENFGGRRAVCPSCGRTVDIPAAAAGVEPDDPSLGLSDPLRVKEFLDPPRESAKPQAAETSVALSAASPLRRMLEALLDPRAIQWMLMIGGGLCVFGVVVWLVSKGVFENKLVLAAALGAGTLAILAAGWFTALRTRYRIAGQALTFLGCVVAPLNLWFYHAQDLVTVDRHLWVGGVVCCLLYAATVWVLRDPLFIYACEAGVTLTALLLLADMGKITDAAWLSLFLMALGLVSIHAERAFSPAESSEFPRKRYGLPMFWSGQAQIGAALATLLASQLVAWLAEPAKALLGIEWRTNLLTERHMLAAGVWLAAAYAYLYSDIVVRRVGVYLSLAGFSLVMAEVTLLLGFHAPAEWIIAAMAITSVAINVAHAQWTSAYKNLERFVPPLGWLLGTVPVVWGVVLHLRATSSAMQSINWNYAVNDRAFAAVMLITAVANRLSAWLVRRRDAKSSAAYFVLSAVSLLMAAAGLLRIFGLTAWSQQAPWMMLIPVGYLVASRLWRGHTAEWPLYWVAQGATAIILLHVFGATMQDMRSFAPMEGMKDSMMLALVFAEAAAFYLLAAMFHRRSVNIHLAAAAACGALWQFMGYQGIDSTYYAVLYAALGVVCLAVARTLGLEQTRVYRERTVFEDLGVTTTVIRGRGLAAYQCGNAILCVALLAAFMQALAAMAAADHSWTAVAALAATVAASVAAAVITPAATWRRFYVVAAVALVAVMFLRLNMLIDLSRWQKLEIFCVVAGLAMLVGSHLALFREEDGGREDAVTFGLALGSVLAAAPLLVAVLYHRWAVGEPSAPDEFALLTVTILMTVTGVGWQIKASTLWGGVALATYLVVLVASLAYHPQVAVGVYLAVGGAAVFGLGVALSIYRDRLLELPERVANREGVFRILNWR